MAMNSGTGRSSHADSVVVIEQGQPRHCLLRAAIHFELAWSCTALRDVLPGRANLAIDKKARMVTELLQASLGFSTT